MARRQSASWHANQVPISLLPVCMLGVKRRRKRDRVNGQGCQKLEMHSAGKRAGAAGGSGGGWGLRMAASANQRGGTASHWLLSRLHYAKTCILEGARAPSWKSRKDRDLARRPNEETGDRVLNDTPAPAHLHECIHIYIGWVRFPAFETE